MSQITAMTVTDVLFATSRDADGSDGTTVSPDCSAAYVELGTDADDGHRGVGLVVTTADGHGGQREAVEALRPLVVGRDVEPTLTDLGATGRELARPRRGGPDPGDRIARRAVGVVLDALWDLRAKREGLPSWRLLASLTPEQIVDVVDFRYLTDALAHDEASALLRAAEPGRAQRREQVVYPAATTVPRRRGVDNATLERWCRDEVVSGVAVLERAVGGDVDDDVRRLGVARAAVGPDVRLAVDARQRWDVDEAQTWLRRLQPFDLARVTEPTSADDVLGHATIARTVTPTPAATGEHRDGADLFHVIDVRDHRAMRTALADDLVNLAWQALVNPLLAEPDCSGRDDGLPLVWSLV